MISQGQAVSAEYHDDGIPFIPYEAKLAAEGFREVAAYSDDSIIEHGTEGYNEALRAAIEEGKEHRTTHNQGGWTKLWVKS